MFPRISTTLRRLAGRVAPVTLALAMVLNASPVMAGPGPQPVRAPESATTRPETVHTAPAPAPEANVNNVGNPAEDTANVPTAPRFAPMPPADSPWEFLSTAAPRRHLAPTALVPPGQEALLRPDKVLRRPPGLASMLPIASVPLATGWNLVSIPEELADSDPAAVLASIAGRYTQVYAYDACDTADPWKVYDPAAPGASDLTSLDPTKGFWIEMTEAAVLTVDGTLPADPAIQLCPGWNLIGYPRADALPVRGALSAIDGLYTTVFGYLPGAALDPWFGYKVDAPTYANDLPPLEPGRGYWVLATEATTLTFTDPGAAPTVAIASPVEGSEITAPGGITGTVASPNLDSWILESRAADGGTWTELATGNTPVDDGRLAEFDPTLLLNGIYRLRLTATDIFGQAASTELDFLVDGQMKIGVFTLSFVDLAIPVSGIPIEIVRTYDSRDKRQHDFGVGWTLDIRRGSYTNNRKPGDGWRIESTGGFFPVPCAVTNETKYHVTEIRFSDVEYYRFALRLGMSGFGSAIGGGCQGTAYFEQIGGIPGAQLHVLEDDTVFWRNGGDQVYELDGITVFEPNAVQLVTLDGRQFKFSSATGLTEIHDQNGNYLIFTEDGILHSRGKSITMERDAQHRIVRIVDPGGRSLSYAYDYSGNLTTYSDQETYSTQYQYDAYHNLTGILDPRGTQIAYTAYDPNGRMVTVTDATGEQYVVAHDIDDRREIVFDRLYNSTTLHYDERGNVVALTDSLGNTTSYTYDSDDNQTSITDPLGNTSHYTYDSFGNILVETDPLGNSIHRAYDATGRLISLIDATGATTSVSYDERGNVVSIQGPELDTWSLSYTSEGDLSTLTNPEGTVYRAEHNDFGNIIADHHMLMTHSGPTEANWRFIYDEIGNIRVVEGPDSSTSVAVFDARGNLTRSISPHGIENNYFWNETGQFVGAQYSGGQTLGVERDELGRTTAFDLSCCGRIEREYDVEGRVIEIRWPDGGTTTKTWDELGRLSSNTGVLGHTSTYIYDAAGRLVASEGSDGARKTYSYDAKGQLISTIDPVGNQTDFRYDEAGRVVQTTFDDGNSIHSTFDGVGQLVSQSTLSGGVWTYQYSSGGRLISTTDPMSNTVFFSQNTDGMVNRITNAKGNAIEMDFDTLGRMTYRMLPEGESETYSYDAAGQLITFVDYSSQVFEYKYNDQGALIQQVFPDNTVENRNYNASGQLASVHKDGETTILSHSTLGGLSRWSSPDGVDVLYTYNGAGQTTAISTTSGTTSHTFAPNGMLVSTVDIGEKTTSYERDPIGRPIETALPNGNSVRKTYDGIGRTTSIAYQSENGSLLYGLEYIRDSAGRLAEVVESTGRRVSYQYDVLDQLTHERIIESDGTEEIISYSYDANSNLISRVDASGLQSFSYDKNDRLLSDGQFVYEWDPNGNLVLRTASDYEELLTYDPQGRLTRFERNGADAIVVTYEYSFDGLIRARTENNVRTIFVWDRASSFLPQLLEERTESGELIARYDHDGYTLSAVHDSSQNTSYYITDHLGTVRAIVSSTGEILSINEFDAFGRSRSGQINGAIGYTGAYTDPVTGMFFLRTRWYAPDISRFIQPDRAIPNLRNTQTLNRYAYSLNNPVNYSDPTGQTAIVELMVAIAIVGILTSVALNSTTANSRVLKWLLPNEPLTFDPLSAWLIGGSLSYTPFGLGTLGTGIDYLNFVDSPRWGIYGYFGIGVSVPIGKGLQGSGAGGLVFNTESLDAYEGAFRTVTLSPIFIGILFGSRPTIMTRLASAQNSGVAVNLFWSPGEGTSHGFSLSRSFPGSGVTLGFTVSHYFLLWDDLTATRILREICSYRIPGSVENIPGGVGICD